MREPQLLLILPRSEAGKGALRQASSERLVAEVPAFLVDLLLALEASRAVGPDARPVGLRALRRHLPGGPSEDSVATEAYELTLLGFRVTFEDTASGGGRALSVDHPDGIAWPDLSAVRAYRQLRLRARRPAGGRAARTDIERVLGDLEVVEQLVNDGNVIEAARVLRAEHLNPAIVSRSLAAGRRRRVLGELLFLRANEGMQRGAYDRAVKEAARAGRQFIGDGYWRGVLHAELIALAALRNSGRFGEMLACRDRVNELLDSKPISEPDVATAAGVLTMPAAVLGDIDDVERQASHRGEFVESATSLATVHLYRAQAAVAHGDRTNAEAALALARTAVSQGSTSWLDARILLWTVSQQARCGEQSASTFLEAWHAHRALGISFPLRYLVALVPAMPATVLEALVADRRFVIDIAGLHYQAIGVRPGRCAPTAHTSTRDTAGCLRQRWGALRVAI